jgi:hypothetical protein
MPKRFSEGGRARILAAVSVMSLLVASGGGGLAAVSAFAAESVKSVGIYVEPFYRAAEAPGAAPRVATGKPYAELLASTRREDILTVRDRILANPKLVTPMTLMVLAIRLYDVGLRDDAVLWFYIAKDRHVTLTDVMVAGTPLLAQADQAMRAFSTLAGPILNGYAFCEIANQRALRAKALAWVESNPYEAIFMDRLPARTADRAAALAQSIRSLKSHVEKERAHLDDPKNAATFAEARKQNAADAKFCWK